MESTSSRRGHRLRALSSSPGISRASDCSPENPWGLSPRGVSAMATPLLATKLYIPLPRPKLVRRARLIARLNEGLQRKLTLVSAPAGFGKTTLLSDWLAGREWPAAWLSLDQQDSDLARFLTYLVAACQTIAAGVGAGVLGAL